MASLTIRNIPEEAKGRFRQLAAMHGRSMEEHMRQLILQSVEDGGPPSSSVRQERSGFTLEGPQIGTPAPEEEDWVHELIGTANGAGEGVFEREPQKLREFDL